MPDVFPILLDTDPGNDIDDALAISYLLKQSRCEFLGITTVSGPVAKRAAIAEVLCNSVGRKDIPIVAGRSDVLAHGRGQLECAQYAPVAHLPHRTDYVENQAVDFLRTTIRNRPGEIVLASIGPFTNLAILFALDPEIPFLLKGLYSMAGRFFSSEGPEWNCLVDPVATAIVANSARPEHHWFGLDVTLQCKKEQAEITSKFQSEPLKTVIPMANNWFDHSKSMIFHDPLTVASIFRPNICSFEPGQVEVDAKTGATVVKVGNGNDKVAKTVDVEGFFDEFFNVTLS